MNINSLSHFDKRADYYADKLCLSEFYFYLCEINNGLNNTSYKTQTTIEHEH